MSTSFMVAGVISSGVGLLVLIAFIVVITTTVRRHRPDAIPILLGAVAFECVISLVAWASQVVLPRFVSLSGTSASGGYVEAYVLSTAVFSIAHGAARLGLLWGIVRLAQPANR